MANSKTALSKNLTQMKFMRRLNPSSDPDELDSSGALIEKWEAPAVPIISAESVEPVITRCGFAECEELNTVGRFSYNKFNKEVERLSKRAPVVVQEEDDGTISAKEVARRYEEITSRKFTGKRKRTELEPCGIASQKFKKPTL